LFASLGTSVARDAGGWRRTDGEPISELGKCGPKPDCAGRACARDDGDAFLDAHKKSSTDAPAAGIGGGGKRDSSAQND